MTLCISTMNCLQESKHKLMAENQTLILVNKELLTKSNQASQSYLAARQEKIGTSLSRHFLGLTVEVESQVTFGI